MTYWLVVGMPRGGTSLVTRILIELGVDMGAELSTNPYYNNAEDIGLKRACRGYHAPNPEWCRRVGDYIRSRIKGTDGPIGGKFPTITNAAHTTGWEDWPVRIIHVRRPLDELILSDLKNYQPRSNANRKERRAAELGRMWWLQQRFIEHHKPVHRIDFNSMVIESPCVRYVSELADTVGISTTIERCQEIAYSVVKDPSQWRTHDARSELARGPSDLDELGADPVAAGGDQGHVGG